jgi:hypothetical protein
MSDEEQETEDESDPYPDWEEEWAYGWNHQVLGVIVINRVGNIH